MVKLTTAAKIRKAYHYLELFQGLQFLMWTNRRLYFSWTVVDEIHRDYFIGSTKMLCWVYLLNGAQILPHINNLTKEKSKNYE